MAGYSGTPLVTKIGIKYAHTVLLDGLPGGVDLATVEALAGGDGDPLDRLHALVDASLLVADAASGRYRVVFIVRAFHTDTLEELGIEPGVELRTAHRTVLTGGALLPAASATA